MNPKVSIIIPTYNRKDLIIETIKSVENQSHTDWECIIVDDHSIDGSFRKVEKYIALDNRFHLYKRPQDRKKGANACRNYGFEKSKGKLVNWFDSDDIMHEDFLKEKIIAIEGKEVDAVISKTAMFDTNPSEISWEEKRTLLTNNLLEDFLDLRIAWYLPDVMWRRDFLLDKELFNENLLAGQDRDFHARMLLYDPNLLVIDSYLTFCRKHEENITSNVDDSKNNTLKISHLYSVVSLVDKISDANKLSKRVRQGLFSAMIKYLPFTLENKSDFNTLSSLLKKLSFPNFNVMIGWIKFYLSLISLKLTGKGRRILR